MKKILLLLLIPFLTCLNLNAQTPFKFETKFYNALDKWVVIPKSAKDSVYSFGFIYLDVMAGPTFQLQGYFKIDADTLKRVENNSLKTASFKYRLGPKTTPLYLLSAKQIAELKLDMTPNWLANYKNADANSYQIAIGNMYNANGRPDLSKPILEKVYQTDKKDSKLIFELSYAYNELKEYNKAVEVLKRAIKDSPENDLYYKELVYAYTELMNLKGAEEVYDSFMINSKSKQYQYEMAFNILQINFENRDKANFDKWATIVEESKNLQFLKNVHAMRESWDKK